MSPLIDGKRHFNKLANVIDLRFSIESNFERFITILLGRRPVKQEPTYNIEKRKNYIGFSSFSRRKQLKFGLQN